MTNYEFIDPSPMYVNDKHKNAHKHNNQYTHIYNYNKYAKY
jgi:hypothetical protein